MAGGAGGNAPDDLIVLRAWAVAGGISGAEDCDEGRAHGPRDMQRAGVGGEEKAAVLCECREFQHRARGSPPGHTAGRLDDLARELLFARGPQNHRSELQGSETVRDFPPKLGRIELVLPAAAGRDQGHRIPDGRAVLRGHRDRLFRKDEGKFAGTPIVDAQAHEKRVVLVDDVHIFKSAGHGLRQHHAR